MTTTLQALPATLAALLLAGSPAQAEQPLSRTGATPLAPFDARALRHLPAEEARFLAALFELGEAAAQLDREVLVWFVSRGEEGLHPEVHAERARDLGERLAELEVPPRLTAAHGYVREARRLQGAFLAEWYAAVREGRPFASQLTDEMAYHEGLHRAHRLLLKAFAELRALYPDADADTLRAFRRRLRALDLK